MIGTELLDPRALEARFGRHGAVHIERHALGGIAARLTVRGCSVVVALQGAQVLSYEVPELGEVLWLSPAARLGTGKAVRGGVPVCWPWFGPHASDSSKPSHGFVRTRDWRVAGSAASDAMARLVLEFPFTPDDAALWPHRTGLQLEVTLNDALTIALTSENRGAAPFVLTSALHSYFAVGDVSAMSVTGLEGRPFIDQLHPGALNQERWPVEIARETDRIYQDTADSVHIDDRALHRRISIAKTGSRSTVLWNPWIEKSARLGDMGSDGYRRMVCVETANAAADQVTLAPGASHRLAARISARALP